MSAKDLARTRAGIQNWGKVLKNEISKQAKIAADAANEAATLWQRGWQNDVNRVLRDFQENVVDKQLDSFDRETQAGLKAIQARYAAQTPEEKALADFEAKRAAADEASKKSDLAAQIADVQSQLDSLGGAATDAGTAVNGTLIDIATGARTALTAAADGAASAATDLVAQRKDLLKQLADLNDQAAQLELDDQERALQAAADASRTAADDKESAEETAYQDDRDRQRQALQDRLDDQRTALEQDLEDWDTWIETKKKSYAEFLKWLSDHGLSTAGIGDPATTTRGSGESTTETPARIPFTRIGAIGFAHGGKVPGNFIGQSRRATYNGWVSWQPPTTSASSASTTPSSTAPTSSASPPSTPPSAAPTTTSARRSPAGRSNEAAATTSTPCSPAKPPSTSATPTASSTPTTPPSPLYGQLEDRLHPVKLTATYNGVTYGRFYGWVRRFHWEPQGRRGITQLECVDLFYWLDRANPVIAPTGPTTTGAAIGKILDAIGATDAGMRDLDTGDTIPDFFADGTKTGARADPGPPRGRARRLLHRRHRQSHLPVAARPGSRRRARTRSSTRSRTPPPASTGTKPTTGHRQRVDATGPSSTPRSRSTRVVAKVGYNDIPTIQTTYLSSNAQADASPPGSSPRTRARSRRCATSRSTTATDDLLTQILTRELVDRITVTAGRGNTSGDFHIDSLTETIDGKTGRHTANWLLSKASPVQPCRSSTSRPSTPATSSTGSPPPCYTAGSSAGHRSGSRGHRSRTAPSSCRTAATRTRRCGGRASSRGWAGRRERRCQHPPGLARTASVP
jgi:hypothetical protein